MRSFAPISENTKAKKDRTVFFLLNYLFFSTKLKKSSFRLIKNKDFIYLSS